MRTTFATSLKNEYHVNVSAAWLPSPVRAAGACEQVGAHSFGNSLHVCFSVCDVFAWDGLLQLVAVPEPYSRRHAQVVA